MMQMYSRQYRNTQWMSSTIKSRMHSMKSALLNAVQYRVGHHLPSVTHPPPNLIHTSYHLVLPVSLYLCIAIIAKLRRIGAGTWGYPPSLTPSHPSLTPSHPTPHSPLPPTLTPSSVWCWGPHSVPASRAVRSALALLSLGSCNPDLAASSHTRSAKRRAVQGEGRERWRGTWRVVNTVHNIWWQPKQ